MICLFLLTTIVQIFFQNKIPWTEIRREVLRHSTGMEKLTGEVTVSKGGGA